MDLLGRRRERPAPRARVTASDDEDLPAKILVHELQTAGRPAGRPAPAPDSRRSTRGRPRSGPCRRSAPARSASSSRGDLAVDAAGRDDLVADLERRLKLLHLLLALAHRHQHQHIEDAAASARTERAAPAGLVGRCPGWAMATTNGQTVTSVIESDVAGGNRSRGTLVRNFSKVPNSIAFLIRLHGVKVKVQIVQRVEGGRAHLAGHEKMAQIGPGMAPAGRAPAVRVGRPVVLGVPGVLDRDGPVAG